MNQKLNKHDDLHRQNRMVYTIMAVSLLVLGLLISISVISARRTDQRKSLDNEATVTHAANDESETLGERAAAALPSRPESSETVDDSAESVTDDGATDALEPESEALPTFIPVAIGQVSKGFSIDVPVYSLTMDDYRVHRGIDVAVPVGSDVFAAAAGTVSAVWEDPLAGCALCVEHSGGAVSTYYNLSRETMEMMRPGMAVAAGDVIGTVGDTSLLEIADEGHVHYELKINGEYVDPSANYEE